MWGGGGGGGCYSWQPPALIPLWVVCLKAHAGGFKKARFWRCLAAKTGAVDYHYKARESDTSTEARRLPSTSLFTKPGKPQLSVSSCQHKNKSRSKDSPTPSPSPHPQIKEGGKNTKNNNNNLNQAATRETFSRQISSEQHKQDDLHAGHYHRHGILTIMGGGGGGDSHTQKRVTSCKYHLTN